VGGRAITISMLAAAALAASGCGSSSSDSSSQSSGGSGSAPAASKGKVSFVSPQNGAKLSGPVKAVVGLEDFKIAPGAVGQAPRPGQGHLHFKMDDGKYDYPKYSGPNGLIGKKLHVNGKYSPALTKTITYKHLPPGKHELEVYLANNNHTNVGVEATVKFTVK
jgi:hypothetical protein